MKIRTKLVHNLTDDEFRRCCSLTKKQIGNTGMRAWMKWLRKWEAAPYRARVFMVEDGETLIGWSLLYYAEGTEVPGPWAHVYVRKSHERRGLGSRLIRALLDVEPDPHVSPYTFSTRKFYLRLGFDHLVHETALRRSRLDGSE